MLLFLRALLPLIVGVTLITAAAVRATPEGRRIQEEGIEKGTALYSILLNAAVRRVKKAVRAAAVENGRDCVAKEGSIRSSPVPVVDLTDEVVASLES